MCMSIDAQVTVCEPVADTTDSGGTLKETVQGSIVKLLDDYEKYMLLLKQFSTPSTPHDSLGV